jgi:8-oxo-dGTP pyrophosphatase MutT (NUDIX family)
VGRDQLGVAAARRPARAPVKVPVLAAATVALLRDGGAGLEVFLLQRNHQSGFVAGAHLFPGGAVDPVDGSPELERRSARPASGASSLLGRSDALSAWVAAVRECFEECGVLLASTADGSALDLRDPATAERFARHRADVDTGRRSFAAVCEEEDLVLSTDRMAYLARWITPAGAPRRYDTRFFVALAPEGQSPRPDQREAIHGEWATPRHALERHAAGDWLLIHPTLRTL